LDGWDKEARCDEQRAFFRSSFQRDRINEYCWQLGFSKN